MPNCQRSAGMDLVQLDKCPCWESGVWGQAAAIRQSPAPPRSALSTALLPPEPAAVPPSQSPSTEPSAPAEPPRGDRELCQPLTLLSDRHRYPGAPRFLLQAPEKAKHRSTSSTQDQDAAVPKLGAGLGSCTPGLAGPGQRQHGASTIPSCRVTPVRGILDSSRTLPNLRFN